MAKKNYGFSIWLVIAIALVVGIISSVVTLTITGNIIAQPSIPPQSPQNVGGSPIQKLPSLKQCTTVSNLCKASVSKDLTVNGKFTAASGVSFSDLLEKSPQTYLLGDGGFGIAGDQDKYLCITPFGLVFQSTTPCIGT